jgi:hypothetical protein
MIKRQLYKIRSMKILVAIVMIIMTVLVFVFRDSIAYHSQPLATGQGVVFFDRWRAQPGYNLIEIYSVPHGTPRCRIIDMDGKLLMTIPGSNCELLADGGFVSNVNRRLVRYDSQLSVVWEVPDLTVRHDIHEDKTSNEIFLWADRHTIVEETMPFSNARSMVGNKLKIDQLIGFNKNGEQSFYWNSMDHIEDLQGLTDSPDSLLELQLEFGDVYEFTHFNSIDIIPDNSRLFCLNSGQLNS